MRAWVVVAASVVLWGCQTTPKSTSTAAPTSASARARPSDATTPSAGVEVDPSEAQAEAPQPSASALARTEYERALQIARTVEARCAWDPAQIEPETLVEAYLVLAPYERSAERDAAIAALERCRQLAAAVVAQSLPESRPEQAPDYTAEVEGAVQQANARTTKRLSITVEGSKVTVEGQERGKRAKKPPKRALEGYCAMADAPDATRVTHVTDDHGEVSCSSKFAFSKQAGYVDRRMGLDTPFAVESTEGRKTPPIEP
ncbi:MAG: hypothetical protein KDK70_31540 [Myxococcales bacterium]|nr:hypothetical protein [Myxococcales bacterium]